MQTVAIGVGLGIAFGVLKITFDVPLTYLLIPLYLLLIPLTIISSESSNIENKCLQNLVRLSCVINRGFSQPVIDAAMNAGAPGATTLSGIEEGRVELPEHGIHINKEVEIIELTMSPQMVDQVMKAMISEINSSHSTAYLYTQHVNKALTYLG